MKKFDMNLFLILFVTFYTALLLRDFLGLIVALPIAYFLYRNLKKEALTPMVNYLIMLLGIFSVFLFPQKAHCAVVLLVSFISVYIFNGENPRFYVGSILLTILAATSTQFELIIFLPAIFFFTLRELKAYDIKFSKITMILIAFIIISLALIPNYQGVINNRSLSSARMNFASPTKSATYVQNVYNFSMTKPSTELTKRVNNIHNAYNIFKLQQKILSWIMLVGFVVAAIVLFTLLYKYTKISGKISLATSILISIAIIALLGFGFYKLISSMSGNWKSFYSTAISYGYSTKFAHKITKVIKIKPLADKLTSLKINVGSMYLIIAEIVLAVFVLLFALKKIVAIETKKRYVDKEELESKKDWFKMHGLTNDVFELYSQFRNSFGEIHLTPREFKDYFMDNYKVDISDLTATFEKARYEGKDLDKPEKKEFIDKILLIIDKLLK